MAVLSRLPRATDRHQLTTPRVLASSSATRTRLTPVEPRLRVVGLEERVATLEARLERDRNGLRRGPGPHSASGESGTSAGSPISRPRIVSSCAAGARSRNVSR